MALDLTKPDIGSTGWGENVNQNFEDIEAAVHLPMNHIAGLKLSNNAGDPDTHVDIATGECRDADHSADLSLSSGLTKRIDQEWEEGTGKGGLDYAFLLPSTLHAVWLIKRSDTGVVDALFSTSFSSPTMPTNYYKKRLIGAVCTDSSSDIVSFVQSGDYFRYKDPVSEVDDSSITSGTWEDATLHVPPQSLTEVYGYVDWTGGASPSCGGLWIRPKGAQDDGTAYAEAFCSGCYYLYFRGHSGRGSVLVDSDSKIQYTAAGGTVRVYVRTIGFMMMSRREP